MQVRLVSVTKGVMELEGKNGQDIISFTARVSNPKNQLSFETAPKLLRYLMNHKHWSPFEMADMTVEIETSRAIAAQILRHRSFQFQEASLRYKEAGEEGYEPYEARRQDVKNRQNSIDDLDSETKEWFTWVQNHVWGLSYQLYKQALEKGIAKECARFLLPLNTQTTLYMKGSVRSWIHYLQVRTDPSTQLEHREIAEAIKVIFAEQFPDIYEAMTSG